MNKNRTEEILNSLDGIHRAMAPDFFYTRLKARLEKGTLPSAEKHWALRPIYAVIALVVVLLINAAVLFTQTGNSTSQEIATVSDSDNIQTLASEYSVTDAGSLYDLNQEK